jgi:TetR/AcrR family transcriptional repressor of nem operon
VAAYEEHWREKQPELDRIFSPQIPPLERLELWCQHVVERQKHKAKKYGHVCGCPYVSLGTELATQDEKIRAKVQQMVDRSIRYVESAIRDARHQELISVEDPAAAAGRIYAMVLGILLQAKIRNNLAALQDLEPAVMEMIGAGAPAV